VHRLGGIRHYQKTSRLIAHDWRNTSRILRSYRTRIEVYAAILKLNWWRKYLERPNLRLINSVMYIPAGTSADHPSNLPLPLPIREPKALSVIGKWGKNLNQAKRLVLSARREVFFRNSLYRNIWRAVKRSGCRSKRPTCPYTNFGVRANRNARFLCRFLNLNLRGCNNNYKWHLKGLTSSYKIRRFRV
jgi:hypothetical protein